MTAIHQPRSLAQLLTNRAIDRDAEQTKQQEQADQAQREREQQAIDRLKNAIHRHTTGELVVALGFTYEYAADLDTDGTARTPARAYFTYEGEQFYITRWGEELHFHGPNSYRVSFGYVGSSHLANFLDAKILDAIAGYPAWLATVRDQASKAKPKPQVLRYTFIDGGHEEDDSLRALLVAGTRIGLTYDDGAGDERGWTYTSCILEDWSDNWLLITTQDSKRSQRLIPLRRIYHIEPLPQTNPLATAEA